MRIPKFNILIATICKPTLIRMIESLREQVRKSDIITVVIDGQQYLNDTFNQLINLTRNFPCEIDVICEETNLGSWGHAIRTKHQNKLRGDFILNADDDDIYLPDALYNIRKRINGFDKLYLFRFWGYHAKKAGFWHTPEIRETFFGNVGTPCGAIPNRKDLPDWECKYGGDGGFYDNLVKLIGKSNVVFCSDFIYCVKPELRGQPEIKINNPFRYFDKIYCINRKSRKDRWQQSIKEFQKLGIQGMVERFEAIEGGADGCRLSHQAIIKEAIENNYDNVLIFEDDVQFLTDDNKLIRKIVSELKCLSWDLFYLGSNLHQKCEHVRGEIYKVKEGNPTHAIAYNKKMFKKVLDIEGIIDVELSKLQPEINAYIGSELIATQRKSFSDIENRDVDYNFIKDRFKMFVK